MSDIDSELEKMNAARVKASDKVREKTRKLVSFADDLPKETSAPTMADAKLNARHRLFVMAPELLVESPGKTPWRLAPDASAISSLVKARLSWAVDAAKSSMTDLLLISDGGSKETRRIVEEALGGPGRVMAEFVVIFDQAPRFELKSAKMFSDTGAGFCSLLLCCHTSVGRSQLCLQKRQDHDWLEACAWLLNMSIVCKVLVTSGWSSFCDESDGYNLDL